MHIAHFHTQLSSFMKNLQRFQNIPSSRTSCLFPLPLPRTRVKLRSHDVEWRQRCHDISCLQPHQHHPPPQPPPQSLLICLETPAALNTAKLLGPVLPFPYLPLPLPMLGLPMACHHDVRASHLQTLHEESRRILHPALQTITKPTMWKQEIIMPTTGKEPAWASHCKAFWCILKPHNHLPMRASCLKNACWLFRYEGKQLRPVSQRSQSSGIELIVYIYLTKLQVVVRVGQDKYEYKSIVRIFFTKRHIDDLPLQHCQGSTCSESELESEPVEPMSESNISGSGSGSQNVSES